MKLPDDGGRLTAFVPTAPTPEEWGARHGVHRSGRQNPARALFAAILENALDMWTADERAWVRSNDETWPCSFLNVCAALELDPEAIRARLRDRPVRARRRPTLSEAARERERARKAAAWERQKRAAAAARHA